MESTIFATNNNNTQTYFLLCFSLTVVKNMVYDCEISDLLYASEITIGEALMGLSRSLKDFMSKNFRGLSS